VSSSNPFSPPTPTDLAIVSAQLGRPVRDVVAIAARCTCGAPTVVSTQPRLSDGTPFPTFYYLTHPAATSSISELEGDHVMNEFAQLLLDDPEIRAAYERAHASYLAAREAVGVVDEIAGISAGGMPTRVKCLHALVGHSLAVGPGINPMGDLALERASWSPNVCACVPYDV
jgi:hypothetical protein